MTKIVTLLGRQVVDGFCEDPHSPSAGALTKVRHVAITEGGVTWQIFVDASLVPSVVPAIEPLPAEHTHEPAPYDELPLSDIKAQVDSVPLGEVWRGCGSPRTEGLVIDDKGAVCLTLADGVSAASHDFVKAAPHPKSDFAFRARYRKALERLAVLAKDPETAAIINEALEG